MPRAVNSLAALLWLTQHFGSSFGAKDPIAPTGGCEVPAAVSVAVGSGKKPEKGMKVLDLNLRSKWVSFGKENSLWLELAAPTVVDSVAVAFRKGHKRVHSFTIIVITTENQAELAFEGTSSGESKDFQIFSLGSKAQEVVAVTVVGYGNNKNDWNGYAEVQLCTRVAAEEAPVVEVETLSSNMVNVELPFPSGRKGFNVVNRCSFPIRVGSTGSQATCGDGTAKNPQNGNCFWALPQGGARDLAPGEASHYVLPELNLKEGSLVWAGNIWASTGCTSDISDDYDHPTTETCVTNYCPRGGVCPDYSGPAGVTTKAEFALQEGGLDFYDVSVIDGANIPIEIVPIDPGYNVNEHYCGIPGYTEVSGELEGCSWKFSPGEVEEHTGVDLSAYTRVVWPADPDNPNTCLVDSDCRSDGEEHFCGVFEERTNAGESKTSSLVSGVCGRPVGWIGAHTACGASAKDGDTFPFDFPYYCGGAARHGTFEQLYRCSGSIYGKQACYLLGAEDSCCGCPPWDADSGGCVSSNPDWTKTAYPWAGFFKSACPTAYSFPRDDRTSMFVCSNQEVDLATARNTQSYSIRFCPGDSEAAFYS